jgi:hypothetical protein
MEGGVCWGHREGRVLTSKPFLQSLELGLPMHPLTPRRVCPPPPPLVPAKGPRLREGGGSQFRRGEIHCGTLGIHMYFVVGGDSEFVDVQM